MSATHGQVNIGCAPLYGSCVPHREGILACTCSSTSIPSGYCEMNVKGGLDQTLLGFFRVTLIILFEEEEIRGMRDYSTAR